MRRTISTDLTWTTSLLLVNVFVLAALVPGGAATYPPAYLAFQSPWCIGKRAVSSDWKYVPMN